MDPCHQHNCPFYELDEGCPHTSQPVTADCDIRPMLPPVDPVSLDPPMFIKFSFRDEWRHIPEKENYPAWTLSDVAIAAIGFREKYKSFGPLVVFKTTDLIDWIIWGELPEVNFTGRETD